MKGIQVIVSLFILITMSQAQEGRLVRVVVETGLMGGEAVYFGTHGGKSYFENSINSKPFIMECVKIKRLVSADGVEIPFNCFENTLGPSKVEILTMVLAGVDEFQADTWAVLSSTSTQPGAADYPPYNATVEVDLIVVASVSLLTSGLLGLWNVGRECADCETFGDLEDFIDSVRLVAQIQQGLLAIAGGSFLAWRAKGKKKR